MARSALSRGAGNSGADAAIPGGAHDGCGATNGGGAAMIFGAAAGTSGAAMIFEAAAGTTGAVTISGTAAAEFVGSTAGTGGWLAAGAVLADTGVATYHEAGGSTP